MGDAIVLAGGAAKGAFGAGVLAGLVSAGVRLDVRRIVATSSGSLNAVYFGWAVREGREREGAEELANLWVDHANAWNAIAPTMRGFLARDGASSGARLLRFVRRNVPTVHAAKRKPIDLRLVIANLAGDQGTIGGRAATTFEHVLAFDGTAFDDDAHRSELFSAVIASAAFPGLYRPVWLPLGARGASVPCCDGGAVNNAPLKHALADPAIDRVFVVAPYPDVMSERGSDFHGFGLLSHLADVLVNERLYRDLRDAHDQNAALKKLESLPLETRQHAMSALGWESRRRVTLIELRPSEALEGGAFEGMFKRRLRKAYVEAGREAARTWAQSHLAREPASKHDAPAHIDAR